jgi:hypothetical protein
MMLLCRKLKAAEQPLRRDMTNVHEVAAAPVEIDGGHADDPQPPCYGQVYPFVLTSSCIDSPPDSLFVRYCSLKARWPAYMQTPMTILLIHIRAHRQM